MNSKDSSSICCGRTVSYAQNSDILATRLSFGKMGSLRIVYQSSHCGHQESVTARTALQGTKIPLFSWILVMFDAIAKTGTSVKYISDVTGVSYHTTKLMFRKIKQTQKQENDTHAAIDCDAIELGCIFLWRKKARKTRMESRRQSQCSCGSDQALRLGGHRMVMRKSLKLQILSNSGLYRVKIKLN